MLVLTRKVGEKLVIGNEVFIEILSVSGEGVRLGVVAPRETSVHRFEVFAEIQENNRRAAAPPPASSDLETIAARLRANSAQDSALRTQCCL